MDAEKAINEILQDLEHQPLQERRTFKAYLNNPELISVSSTNAIHQSPPINYNTNNAYYNFTVNLPRPAIGAKSLQLLKAIIPQAQCSIPDYSLVFPYYRLRTVPIDVDGHIKFVDKPTFENLFFIRLLPSYYKPELIQFCNQVNPNLIGLNKTFNYYEELATELAKACNEDITFNYATHYFPEDIAITYSSEINKFQFEGLNVELEPVAPTYDQWDQGADYIANTIVFYQKDFYKSLNEIPAEYPPPPEDPTNWERVFVNSYVPWDVDIVWNKDDVVWDEVTGLFYICIVDSTFQNPPPNENPEEWLNVSQFFDDYPIFTTYIVAGYEDKNVDRLLQYVEEKSTPTYSGVKDYIVGDFSFSSIPGNKYVQYQTLARRLGFTWDGNGMVPNSKINDYIDTGITFGSTIALYYNRFRPVPLYQPAPPETVLLEAIKSNFNTYTADGYCNMVYSSIINIYTTIIGTSSVDTQRNANLLATLEFNAPNLGVAMVNNFIDTKLTKLQPDIYSIYFELRDENGVEYYLTNNATTTLLLKLTYPE